MTDQSEQVFQAAIVNAMNEARRLEAVLSRTIQLLTQKGLQLSVDLVGMTQHVQTQIEEAHQRSEAVFEQMEQLEELLRTFGLVTSSLDLDHVLNEVIDTIVKLTGAERVYLMMRDRDTHELRTLVARNWNSESLSENDVVFSRNVVQMAIERGEPVLTTNAKDDTRLKFYESVIDNDMRSILCIPLTMRGEVVGVLYADNRLTQDVFKPEKVPLLAAFGAQAAIAIENAQAFGQVKRDLDRALTELENLQIRIDQTRVDEQVNEIVESDYFQQLASAAKSMRSRYAEGGEPS